MNGKNEPVAIILDYIDCINAGDSKKLVTLQTEDFAFTDMGGSIYIGRDGWEGYFNDYPEYKIHVKHILMSGDGVAIVGTTTGSHVESKYEEKETVLWVAEVKGGLVASWRIYSNLEEVKKRLEQ